MTSNEKYLFEEIKAGNKSAFENIFRLYYQDLCRFALRLSCSEPDAEEIVQDLFFKLWQNHKTMICPDSVKAYLFTATRNSVYNKIKHEKIKSSYIQDQNVDEYDLDSSELIENQELNLRIESAINELPEKRREVFVLSKIDGLKYKEIAEKLNISIKTVENQMGEALKFLRDKLSSTELLILILLTYLINIDFLIGVFNNLIVYI